MYLASTFRTSDELLRDLFSVFGANVNFPDVLTCASEKKRKKKKKRKYDDLDVEAKSKRRKLKKSKKVKDEPCSDREDSKEHIGRIKKVNRSDSKKSIKQEITESRKLSIVIKDLKTFKSQIVKPTFTKSSKEKEKKREKERQKDKRRISKEYDCKTRERKSVGNVSDISLSDEETYRKMLEYHTSSQWYDSQRKGNHIREWDRDKFRRERSRGDDRQ